MTPEFAEFLEKFNKLYARAKEKPSAQFDTAFSQSLSLIEKGVFYKDFFKILREKGILSNYQLILREVQSKLKEQSKVDLFLDKGYIFSLSKTGFTKKTKIPPLTQLIQTFFEPIEPEFEPIITLFFSKDKHLKFLSLYWHFFNEEE